MFEKYLSTIFVTFFLFLVFSQTASAAATDDFVIQVKTDNPGSSSDAQFTIPTTGVGYSYGVDCDNNGSSEARGVTGDYTCNYAMAGTYTIRIHHNLLDGSGFPRIYFNDSGDKLKIVSLDQWGTGHWTSMRQAFFGTENMLTPAVDSPNLTQVQDLTNMFASATLANPNTSGWNTSSIESMYHMFGNATSANPDTSSWDTSSVNNMGYIFYNAVAASPDTSNWITSSVHLMHGMFRGAIIANPDTSNWNTSNVIWMQELFYGATIANPNTSNWDVSSVTSMGRMFMDARAANPDTSSWDTSSVKYMNYMFTNAIVANPDTSNWDTSSVIYLSWMFNGALMATPDTSDWNTMNVIDMNSMFFNAIVANPNTSGWNTSKVTTMKNMFFNAASANPNTSNWDTSQVTDMRGMFINAPIAEPNTSNWNTTNVTNMTGMFNRATVANPDTSGWDTGKVESMDYMFWRASDANPNTSNWNTSSVTNMEAMFAETNSANPDTSNWNTEKVTNMNHMFSYSLSANPDTTNWNTSSVTNMSNMFNRAALANPDTSGWNTSKVETMDGMFILASMANPDTSNWNTSLVTNMQNMFHTALLANPDTSHWDVSSTGSMNSMFYGVTLPTIDYEAMLIGFNNQTLQSNVGFHGGFSQYCSFIAQTARADMVANDAWNIIDGGICAPEVVINLMPVSDTGSMDTDNITRDNTPELLIECSFIGNNMKIYSNKPVNNTLIATQSCATVGMETVSIITVLSDEVHDLTYTQTDMQGESAFSDGLLVTIDTSLNTPNCSTIPLVATNGVQVTTTCDSVELGASLSIENMMCSPLIADATGVVSCLGTVGTNTGQVNVVNDEVLLVDLAGNSNNMATTGLNINFNAVANSDLYTTDEDSNVVELDVLLNDSDVEGDDFYIVSVTQPTNGVVVIDAVNNVLNYLPNENYCNNGMNTDDFRYAITGGGQAQVSINVNCINDAPSFDSVCDIDVSDYIGISNQSVQMQLQNIIMGPDNELSQQVQMFNTSIDDPDGIFIDFIVDDSGLVMMNMSLNTGIATIGVSLTDNGGTASGGQNTSDEHEFEVVNIGSDFIPGLLFRDSFDRDCDFIP